MTNGRKQSRSQRPHSKPQHLPKVGSNRQIRWDRRQRLADLEFDVAWVIGVVLIIVALAVIAYFVG